MDLAWLTLLALAVVVALSCTSRVNPGIVAIALAWLVAKFAAPWLGVSLGDSAIIAGFPSQLFLTLLAVSLLFALAETNGALTIIADGALRLVGQRRTILALTFFIVAWVLGTLGPGNIAAAAIMAPIAMAAAERTGISPLLMAILVGHGSIASTVSPFTAAGVVANQILAQHGIADVAWQLFAWNAAANGVAALLGYALLGGFSRSTQMPTVAQEDLQHPEPVRYATRSQALTLAVLGIVIGSVLIGGVPIGLAAICGAAVIMSLGLSDERGAMARIPWSVIVMVIGVSVLTSLLEKTGASGRMAGIISGSSTRATLTPMLAAVTGVVSIYSSTTGVVLPVFLPLVKAIATASGAQPLSLALTVLVSGNLVDMSPLSTIGALCLAAAPEGAGRRMLFNQLLAWGFAMAALGALLSWLCFT